MSAASNPAQENRQTGCYVYGVLPADIEINAPLTGVGDPPGEITVVRYDGLAALVSAVDLARPLGTPEDLAAHKQILDACVPEVPVLPMQFGAVLTDEDAVAEDLLEANHDEFAAALRELDGRVEYVVKGRYIEKSILREVLSENREAAELRDAIRGEDVDATRDARMRLGEIVNDAIAAKRAADTRTLGDQMQGHCVASVVRDPTHERDAVHTAFLLETSQERELEQVTGNLASDWNGRVELRIQGPMAAYDFVVSAAPQG